MLWICFQRLLLHFGKGLGGVGKEGLSSTKVVCKMNSSFKDTGPFSNQTRAQREHLCTIPFWNNIDSVISTFSMCHNTVALDDQVQLEKCTRSLFFFHAFMYMQDLWPDVHARVLLRICGRWSFGRMFGVPCVMVLTLGKSKGYDFLSTKYGKESGCKCELYSIPWMWFYSDLSYSNVSQLESTIHG